MSRITNEDRKLARENLDKLKSRKTKKDEKKEEPAEEGREEVSTKLKQALGAVGKKSTKPITDDDLKNMPKFINALIERGKIFSKKDPRIPRKPNPINRAKGGEVKGYMGGGSVHKKKNKMATTKGWGASRKT